MKKILRFGLLVFFLSLCTGCKGTITREIRHAGFTVGSTFTCQSFFPQGKGDTGYKRIAYLTDNHLIDDSGKIYEVSLGQVYANQQNCKEATTDLRVEAIMDNQIIRATDGKFYYLIGHNDVASYSVVLSTDNSYPIYKILLGDPEVKKVITANSSTGLYYVLKTDGNVYAATVNRVDYNSPPILRSSNLLYDKVDYGSNIVDFNYAGETPSTFIRTDEKVYRMKVQNGAECNKYADIQCVYKIEEDLLFEKYRDSIIVFNGKVLITDYHQMFNISG